MCNRNLIISSLLKMKKGDFQQTKKIQNICCGHFLLFQGEKLKNFALIFLGSSEAQDKHSSTEAAS